MNIKFQKVKKIIKNFKYIIKTENEIDIYLKYRKESDLKKLNNKEISEDKLRQLKDMIAYVKRMILEQTKKMDYIGENVCKLFCLKGKSITAISMEYYISATTAYREINKLAFYLYIIYLKNKKFENSVNYLINELQKNI